jgi:hypothetical protein
VGKNNKPMLTVLVEGDKLQRFRDYAQSQSVSMGWIVNQLVDRVLAGELDPKGQPSSIGISTGTPRGHELPPAADIDRMVRFSIDNQLVGSNRDYIEELIKNYIDSLDMSSTGKLDIESMVSISIEMASEPIAHSIEELRSELSEVSEFARNLQGEIVKVKKPLAIV